MQPSRFIGLHPPDALTSHISRLQKSLLKNTDARTPLEPHITLLHPAMLQEIGAAALVKLITTHAAPYLPCTITFTNVDAFGRSTLYISVESPQLTLLRQALAAQLPGNQSKEPYTPHLTLAQAQPNKQLPIGLDRAFIDGLMGSLPYNFAADSLCLYTRQAPRRYTRTPLASN